MLKIEHIHTDEWDLFEVGGRTRKHTRVNECELSRMGLNPKQLTKEFDDIDDYLQFKKDFYDALTEMAQETPELPPPTLPADRRRLTWSYSGLTKASTYIDKETGESIQIEDSLIDRAGVRFSDVVNACSSLSDVMPYLKNRIKYQASQAIYRMVADYE